MFSVIFEVLPNKENWDDYLDNAKMLRPELEQVEGFIADHHGEVTALGSVFGGPVDRRKSVGKRYLRVCISAQGSDGVKKLSAMPDQNDAQILQVVCRQGRQDCLVYLIFAECRLVPFEAKAPQPTPDVHPRALALASA
jgi:hypothetical protein